MKIVENKVAAVRVALGGVAHKPWRDLAAEEQLVGEAPSDVFFQRFSDGVLSQARGQGQNDFKIELARRTMVRALQQARDGTPQDQSDKSVR